MPTCRADTLNDRKVEFLRNEEHNKILVGIVEIRSVKLVPVVVELSLGIVVRSYTLVLQTPRASRSNITPSTPLIATSVPLAVLMLMAEVWAKT